MSTKLSSVMINHTQTLNLSNLTNPVSLSIGRKPLRIRQNELKILNGINHAVQLFTGRRHNGSGSTATRFYHVYVSGSDFDRAMELISKILAGRKNA